MNKDKRAKRAKVKAKELRLKQLTPERIEAAKSRKLSKKYASKIAQYKFTAMAKKAAKEELNESESE